MPDNDAAVRLMLGYLCVSRDTETSLPSKVDILDRFGLPDAEIAAICGATNQSVRNARQASKKANGKKKK
jgi:hypothetical protein